MASAWTAWLVAAATIWLLLYTSVRNSRKRIHQSNEWLARKTMQVANDLLTHEWIFCYFYVVEYRGGVEDVILNLSRVSSREPGMVRITLKNDNPDYKLATRLRPGMVVKFRAALPEGKDPMDVTTYVCLSLEKEIVMDRL